MSPRKYGKGLVWARRAVQFACLALFLYWFWAARLYKEGAPPSGVTAFFDIDPLVMLATALSAHAIPMAGLLALATVLLTVLLGRVFCGWICPLGTIHHFASWLGQKLRRGRAKAEPFNGKQRAKYYVLAALLLMALFGVHWIGMFDPISLLSRTMATVLYPASQYAVEESTSAAYDLHVGPIKAKMVSEPIYQAARKHVFITPRQTFTGSTWIALFFVGIVLLNVFQRRFWCRYVCPLGGLLGWLSSRQVLRVANAPNPCRECGRCATKCPAGASPEKPGQWRATECFGCWNCVAACPFDAIKFRAALPITRPSEAKLDLGKRATLAAGAGGVAGLLVFRLTPQAQGTAFVPGLIRPPGARAEQEFLQRCLSCGVCMKACPTNALHPAGLEAGLEGLWTPKLIPHLGYCEYNCNLCGQVCPTEAIQKLPLEKKRVTKIGLASFDMTRCLPWAYERDCMICEEHCPLSKKAIYFKVETIQKRDGSTMAVKRPYVDPELCIGCGICASKCVFRDKPAINVSSSNETRHSNNQPILPPLQGESFSAPAAPAAPPVSTDPYGGSATGGASSPY